MFGYLENAKTGTNLPARVQHHDQGEFCCSRMKQIDSNFILPCVRPVINHRIEVLL